MSATAYPGIPPTSHRQRRKQLRAFWLGDPGAFVPFQPTQRSPLPPAVTPGEIHDLLTEMSSGTRPCTSCCTQCSGDCCNASCII